MLAKANRTDEYLDRLSAQTAKEIAKKNIGMIRVKIGLTGRDYDENLVEVKCYDDLTPQLELLVLKIQYWAQEALEEEHGSWNYLANAKKEVNESEALKDKYGRIAAWSMLTAFAVTTLLRLH